MKNKNQKLLKIYSSMVMIIMGCASQNKYIKGKDINLLYVGLPINSVASVLKNPPNNEFNIRLTYDSVKVFKYITKYDLFYLITKRDSLKFWGFISEYKTLKDPEIGDYFELLKTLDSTDYKKYNELTISNEKFRSNESNEYFKLPVIPYK